MLLPTSYENAVAHWIMRKTLTRRDFVKLTGVAGAALGVGTADAQTPTNPPGWRGHERVERIATNCEMCFWRCGAVAEVADGKVVRVSGNPDHPLTKGRLCARGNAGTELLYDNDRLKYPMVRVGARGEGKFQRVSWEQALDLFAQRLGDLKQKYGAGKRCVLPARRSLRVFQHFHESVWNA